MNKEPSWWHMLWSDSKKQEAIMDDDEKAYSEYICVHSQSKAALRNLKEAIL